MHASGALLEIVQMYTFMRVARGQGQAQLSCLNLQAILLPPPQACFTERLNVAVSIPDRIHR